MTALNLNFTDSVSSTVHLLKKEICMEIDISKKAFYVIKQQKNRFHIYFNKTSEHFKKYL